MKIAFQAIFLIVKTFILLISYLYMKIRDLLASDRYQQKKVLEKLLCHHTGLSKEDLIRHYDDEVEDDVIEKVQCDYNEYVNDDKPLEYIF